MTANLLQQTAATRSDLPEPVLSLRTKFKSKDTKPQLQDLEKAFLLVCQKYKRVFVTIDALDECDERMHRQTFIRVLYTLREQINVRLFITSRPHPHDIKKAFSSVPQITIEASESDLRKYSSKAIETSDAVEPIDESFKIDIVEKVAGRANEM